MEQIKVESALRPRLSGKHKRHRDKPLKEKIDCECGNEIKMFNTSSEVKCFRCNCYLKRGYTGWQRYHKCDCGKQISITKGQEVATCECSKRYVHLKSANSSTDMYWVENLLLECDCGNKIPISEKTDTKKCFACNHQWEKTDGKWNKEEMIEKDQLTLGDIRIRTRKKVV